ncbi:uncharacterized protein LOC133858478 isoform X2 [Alnus glutinosa]|uniref:uncharacterized protein LOC133858478 isoform X2 n=1 Tax=Alnus glutinosa TaxID=3517 RepID=UPI002D79D060|nr:uncharacterized protein LOC133858478 isoform X2 [Alnus glutinosa]
MGRTKLVWMMMAMMMNMCVLIMAVEAEKALASSPSPSPSPNSPVPRNWLDPHEIDEENPENPEKPEKKPEKPEKRRKLPKFYLPPKFHLLCICVMHCDQACKAANPYPAYLACFFGCLPIKCNPWRLDAVYRSKSAAFGSGGGYIHRYIENCKARGKI